MEPPPDESSNPAAATSAVDALLERYLALLDEYTSLRAELSRLQAATFQHLARANFAAERGARYGADAYDERMQAIRTVVIGEGPLQEQQEQQQQNEAVDGVPTFQVVVAGADGCGNTAAAAAAATDTAEPERKEKEEKSKEEEEVADDESSPSSSSERPDGAEQARRPPDAKRDPLRWFGVLTPPALRQTQACAIEAVGRVVPRLATVDAAMRAVEIEVRRARKKRAKAEAAAAAVAEREDGQRELGQGRVAREEVPAS